MKPLFDLNELVGANVITHETALKISDYYKKKQAGSPGPKNKQLLMFAIAGALLVGIGLMFIIANQWEELPKTIKTISAFLLLIIPQILCLYALLWKGENVVWKESTALLLFFAVGASISLVSQIYHINGDTSTFLLKWMLLTVPLVYIMDVSSVSLAYLFGILSYGFAVRFDIQGVWAPCITWLLFLLPIPRYLKLFGRSPDSPLFILHHWIIPFVLLLSLVLFSRNFPELMTMLYLTLFGIYFLIGNIGFFRNRPAEQGGYRFIGMAGTVITLFVMSFRSNWEKLPAHRYDWNRLLVAPEFIALALLFVFAALLLIKALKHRRWSDLKFMEISWVLFLPLFILGYFSTFPYILVNLFLLGVGVQTLRIGSAQDNLGLLNAGLLILAFLLVCRSFDIDLTYVEKGLLFVAVGIGFFIANWWMLRKKRQNEA